jgi:hypothetical protein
MNMKVSSKLKAGLGGVNHTQALKVSSKLKSGLGGVNHSQSLKPR